MAMTSQRQAAYGFLLALGVLGFITVTTWRYANSYIDNTRWVEHTHEVMSKIERLQDVLHEIESNARGYILTGDEAVLRGYQTHREEIRLYLESLTRMTTDMNGCTPPPSPIITLSGPNVILSGQSIVLTSTISGGYLWSTGSTSRTITVSNGGTYTVRSYNKGGCFSTSLPLTITVLLTRLGVAENTKNSNELSESFSVYPNPARDQLNIVFNQAQEKNIFVKLLDISGREIQNLQVSSVIGENRVYMDVSTLSRGIYLACLISDGPKQVIKVIIE